ncbi:MAG: hypothetical protein JXB47_07515 [Anaerolineae bacterium]|nr:hypothetical protein [Anaerolineae bacterium]
MKTGMLWFDDDKKRSLAEKVTRAVTYYEQKYKVTPNVCYVHPSTLEEPGDVAGLNGLELRTAKQVRRNHFWVGIEEQSSDRRAA